MHIERVLRRRHRRHVDDRRCFICTLMIDATSDITGTYTTSGSTLHVTSNGVTTNGVTYCVTGSTLAISVPGTTAMPGPVYVLARQ